MAIPKSKPSPRRAEALRIWLEVGMSLAGMSRGSWDGWSDGGWGLGFRVNAWSVGGWEPAASCAPI